METLVLSLGWGASARLLLLLTTQLPQREAISVNRRDLPGLVDRLPSTQAIASF